MFRTTTVLAGCVAAFAMSFLSAAETTPGGGDATVPPVQPRAPARDGMRRGGGALDLASVKAKISASDEEWKVIGPKLQKVVFARQAAEPAISADSALPAADAKDTPVKGKDTAASGPRGGDRGGPGGNGAFTGPSGKIGGDFGPGGPPPPGFGPDGGPPPGFGPDGGPPPGFGPRGGPPGFGPGGGPPPGFGGQGSAVTQALAALRTALADAKTTPQELQEKVAEVRAVRQRVRKELAAAEKDLRELLTADQEATLISLGHIE